MASLLEQLVEDDALDEPPSNQTLDEALAVLRQRWLVPIEGGPARCFEWACRRVGADPRAFTIEANGPSAMDKLFSKQVLQAAELYKIMYMTQEEDNVNETMLSDQTDAGMRRQSTFKRIFQALHHARQLVVYASAMIATASDAGYAALGKEESLRTLFFDDDKKSHQTLIIHILELLRQRRYRKFEGACYAEVRSPTGERTHAWTRACTILEFIYENVTTELNFPMWKEMTSSLQNPQLVAEYLGHSRESDFPPLEFRSSIFSFSDGIFNATQLAFYPYSERSNWDAIAAAAVERMGIDCPEAHLSAPGRGDVSMKYFDVPFGATYDACGFGTTESILDIDASMIECPEVEKILEDQKLEPETVFWFFVAMGRLLFPVGLFDNWQILVFLKGVAGSGKSTMAQLMKYLYSADQVGVLSSNAEGKFGLAPLYKKALVICPEAKRDFSISQGDLQSMISGEDVSVAIKHKMAETVKWEASLLFCGNEIPAWQDASNSMARRLFVFVFNYCIRSVDTGLFRRMQENAGKFLLRISLSYRQAVIRFGANSIWDRAADGEFILPQQLRLFHEEVMYAVQPIMNYLQNSGDFKLCYKDDSLDAENTYIPESLFLSNFRDWCKRTSIEMPVWTEDSWRTTFQDLGITRRYDSMHWDGQHVTEFFLFGVTFRDHLVSG